MIIINVKDGNIEKALKEFKRKTIKIKQMQTLQEKKEFKKKSAVKRLQQQKAEYKQQKNTNQ
jgi:ribosomal protein S21